MTERRTLPKRRRHEVFEFEHGGLHYVAGIGRFEGGALAEIFLDAAKPGSAAETAARDAAIVTSIALQFGADIGTIRHALSRLNDGSAAGPLGKALDIVEANR